MYKYFENAEVAFANKNYKKAFSSINKLKRSKVPFQFEHCLLEAKIYFFLEKYEKSIAALATSESLAADNIQKVGIHNLQAEVYGYLEQTEDAINHLEQSLLLDGSITNADARLSLLGYYVTTGITSNALEVGNKLLNWGEYFIPASFLMLDVAVLLDNKKLVLELINPLLNRSKYLDENQVYSIFNKLVEADELDEADSLIARDIAFKGKQTWHQICEAIVKINRAELNEAFLLFEQANSPHLLQSFDFYIALRSFYFNHSRETDFFDLFQRFKDDHFRFLYIEESISRGQLQEVIDSTFTDDFTGESFDKLKIKTGCNQLIANWVLGNISQCQQILKENASFISQASIDKSLVVSHIFFSYIKSLLSHNKKNIDLVASGDIENLYVIGESHSLALCNRLITFENTRYKSTVKFIKGVQMQHLGSSENNKYKYYFKNYIKELAPEANLLLTIGEIDCRIEQGISKAATKQNTSIEDIVNSTVTAYFYFVKLSLSEKSIKKVFIQGVPAPYIDTNSWQDVERHIKVIKKVNARLRELALEYNWVFIDVYSATKDVSGWSHGKLHLDKIHLKPTLYDDLSSYAIYRNDN